jgi:hypothetical protein
VRAQSFFIQRRVTRVQVQGTLGELTIREGNEDMERYENETHVRQRTGLRRTSQGEGRELHVCHTHATMGEQIGMALSDRQAQMGHGDVRTTMHYTHSDLERRRADVEVMSERLTALAAGTVN